MGLGCHLSPEYARTRWPTNPLSRHPRMQAGLAARRGRAAGVRALRRPVPHRGRQPPDQGGRQAGAAASALAAAATATADDVDAVSDDVVMGAVAVELVHLGSLYHDDVMDGPPPAARSRASAQKWGNLRAILAGDFLLAGPRIAASLGVEVAGLLAATIGRLCEGRVRELRDTHNVGRTGPTCPGRGKTASPSPPAGRLPSSATSPGTRSLSSGLRFSMAFRSWTILDVTATDEQRQANPSGATTRRGRLHPARHPYRGEAGTARPRQPAGGPWRASRLDRPGHGPGRRRCRPSLETAAATQSAVRAARLPTPPPPSRLGRAAQHLLATSSRCLSPGAGPVPVRGARRRSVGHGGRGRR